MPTRPAPAGPPSTVLFVALNGGVEVVPTKVLRLPEPPADIVGYAGWLDLLESGALRRG